MGANYLTKKRDVITFQLRNESYNEKGRSLIKINWDDDCIMERDYVDIAQFIFRMVGISKAG